MQEILTVWIVNCVALCSSHSFLTTPSKAARAALTPLPAPSPGAWGTPNPQLMLSFLVHIGRRCGNAAAAYLGTSGFVC
jgi:hypothetical protein